MQATKKLLKRFLRAMAKHKIPFAVGGGVAVNAHGFRRETTDIDAFLHDEDRARVRTALLEAGFRIGRIYPPFHYIAVLPGIDDPDIRIDLLYPAAEPDLSAIDHPTLLEVWGECVPVFAIEFLIASKLQAIADQPARASQDRADIATLYSIGAFVPGTVKYLLSSFASELEPLLDEIIKQPKGQGSLGRRR